jgi:hypothetical protein
MVQQNRPNPKGMSQDLDQSRLYAIGQGYSHNPVAAMATPVDETVGYDVKDWAGVHVCFYGEAATCANTVVRMRTWRYYHNPRQDVTSAIFEGRWIMDNEILVPLDPLAAGVGLTAHHVFDTRDAEKMYWQFIRVEGGAVPDEIFWQPYGLIRKDEPHVIAAADIVNPIVNADVEVAGIIGGEESIYANHRGDFDVIWVTNTTLRISGLEGWTPETGNFVRVGIINAAVPNGVMKEYTRGIDLAVSYAPATGILTIPAGWVNSIDDQIFIWLEGPPKAFDRLQDAKRATVTNPDALHNAEDGVIFDGTVSGPEDEEATNYFYVPFNMAQDGYHQFTARVSITQTGGENAPPVYVALYATDDIDPNDADCNWYDVTQLCLNIAPFDTTLTIMPVSGVHWRRMRWRFAASTIPDGEQGWYVGAATIAIRMSRTTYDEAQNVDFVSQQLLRDIITALASSGKVALPTSYENIIDGTATDGGTGNTITCAGFPFTVADTNCKVRWVLQHLAAGGLTYLYVDGAGGCRISSAANTITVTVNGVAPVPNFDPTDTFSVGIRYQDKGYTAASNSFRSEEINPLNDKYVRENLVDAAVNVTAGTYYPSSAGIEMAGYKDCSIEFQFTAANNGTVTMTVEATNAADPLATADWVDITQACYSGNTNSYGNASYATAVNGSLKDILFLDELNVRAVRVLIVVAVGNSTLVQIDVRRKSL